MAVQWLYRLYKMYSDHHCMFALASNLLLDHHSEYHVYKLLMVYFRVFGGLTGTWASGGTSAVTLL